MGLRAQRKKMAKKFKVGDTVTWGRGVSNSQVIELAPHGLWVKDDFSPRHFVPFVFQQTYGSTSKPLSLVKAGP